MSCCPPIPDIQVAEVIPDEPTAGAEVQRIPGESEDCFMARAGNVTESGNVGDKTLPVSDKIRQNSIVPDGTATINLQFTTTGPTVVTNWVFAPTSFPGVTTTTGGLLSGTFDPSVHKQPLQLRVQAMNGVTIIDDRTYNFSPSLYDDSTSVKLVHPLPGSRVTSTFGPRKSPGGVGSSNHGGVDMAYSGGRTEDVFCAADGEVVLARPGKGYGNYVMVRHLDGAGNQLITTLYAHLESIYVKLGQKVSGGQALGKEGNTGVGTGAHLHFEVRLPNNTKVDPMPYLQGAVVVANVVNPDNTPDLTGGSTVVLNNAAMTSAEVSARSTCEPFGPSYPSTGVPPTTPPFPPVVIPPTIADDPFELAWYFTMTHEVNPRWMTTPDRSPSDPDVAAGLILTSYQRERVGFINHPKDPGGVTKFGVAQRFNPSIRIEAADYALSRQTGYNVYWLSSVVNCETIAATSVKIAVMAFDMNYALGEGGCKKVMTAAGVTGTETGAAEDAALIALRDARISYLLARPNFATFGKGWTRRANESLAYAQSI